MTMKMHKAALSMLTLLVLQGCVTAQTLNVEPPAMAIVEMKPLSIAVVIPAATRELAVARYKHGGCFGLSDIPGNFGTLFVDTVRDRFSRLFEKAIIVNTMNEARDVDAVFEASLTGVQYRLGCIASPDGMFSAEGTLRSFDANGRQAWTSSRNKSVQSLGMVMKTDIGTDLSQRIAALVDDWTNELQVVPLARYAPGAETAAAKASPGGILSRRLGKEAIDVSFKKMPTQPDDVAVIIGNADYTKLSRDIPDVTPAYADAAGIRKFVVRSLGVRPGNIIDLSDATGSQMIRVFGSAVNHKGQLYDWIKPGKSRVFVYYAGHGAPSGNEGSAYLVPSDADAARIDLNGYPLKTLYRNLGKIPAKSVTVVLEACFSGAAQSGQVITKASPVFVKPKTPPVPANVTVIAAGAPDQMASWQQDAKHSLFTTYYLKGMAGEADAKPHGNGDGSVTLTELNAYLKETLTYYARRYYGRDQTAQIVVGKGE